MQRPAAPTVVIGQEAFSRFLDQAIRTYAELTPQCPTPCFAVLVGTAGVSTVDIRDVVFGGNVRASDSVAVEEFTTTIAPRFGAAYENDARGFWLDSRDQLRIARDADDRGLELLGSIHMHPDWHRIGPPSTASMPLSERPTPMDEYVFGLTGWPVNLICYLERLGGALCYVLQAWGRGSGTGPCQPLPLRIRTDGNDRANAA